MPLIPLLGRLRQEDSWSILSYTEKTVKTKFKANQNIKKKTNPPHPNAVTLCF